MCTGAGCRPDSPKEESGAVDRRTLGPRLATAICCCPCCTPFRSASAGSARGAQLRSAAIGRRASRGPRRRLFLRDVLAAARALRWWRTSATTSPASSAAPTSLCAELERNSGRRDLLRRRARDLVAQPVSGSVRTRAGGLIDRGGRNAAGERTCSGHAGDVASSACASHRRRRRRTRRSDRPQFPKPASRSFAYCAASAGGSVEPRRLSALGRI